MQAKSSSNTMSRREFFQKLAIGAAIIGLGKGRLFGLPDAKKGEATLFYKYRTISVQHFPELENDIEALKQSGKLSDHPTYRSYIDNKHYVIPDDFSGAKSLIIVAVYTPLAYVKFHSNNDTYKIPIPPQYWDDGISVDMIETELKKSVVTGSQYRIQRAKGILLKRLGVCSGLSQYGRNNISYVQGMGSFLTLLAYFTDYSFSEDHFQDIRMMDSCRSCRICRTQCPNSCISDDNFVIDAGRCLSLYNEIEGEFPDWIAPDAHNALMGCLQCQRYCPANRDVIKKAVHLGEVNEADTHQFLDGESNAEIRKTIADKLKNPFIAESEEYYAVFQRNLGVLIPDR